MSVRLTQALEAGGARRLRNESFFSAPQLKRDPLGSYLSYTQPSKFRFPTPPTSAEHLASRGGVGSRRGEKFAPRTAAPTSVGFCPDVTRCGSGRSDGRGPDPMETRGGTPPRAKRKWKGGWGHSRGPGHGGSN